jgi:hypothetical protein
LAYCFPERRFWSKNHRSGKATNRELSPLARKPLSRLSFTGKINSFGGCQIPITVTRAGFRHNLGELRNDLAVIVSGHSNKRSGRKLSASDLQEDKKRSRKWGFNGQILTG